MARDDFQLAAKRAESRHSPAEWLSLGQRGRSAAIYKELRGIDREAAKRLAAKTATARRNAREGEVRPTRHEAIRSMTGNLFDRAAVMGSVWREVDGSGGPG